ncbi:Tungstate-binding protein TupA [bioreactor metagenome]|uniref:Tungstate-binding protein TupA n=1 Tax=bioreactor metagenome TaxID=1076179 RepID=A0A645H5P8_9ZZZZ
MLAQAKMGNADLILLDDKALEEAFVADGYAMKVDGYDTERFAFFTSDYVLAGPLSDPAKCAEAGSMQDAFARIAEGKFPFVSRGDFSATHQTEATLWPSSLGISSDPASIAASSEWYFSGDANMSTCLTMANEMDGYLFTDKASFLVFAASGGAVG